MNHYTRFKPIFWILFSGLITFVGVQTGFFSVMLYRGERALSYGTSFMLDVRSVITDPVIRWRERRATFAQLQQQVVELREENNTLREAVYDSCARLEKYAHCAPLIEQLRGPEWRMVCIARVSEVRISPHEQMLIIDRGTWHGITCDMVAMADGAFVGRVVEAYPTFCHVLLVTDQRCAVSAVCQESGVLGVHEGINDAGTTVLKYVSHLAPLKEGELVLSSGAGRVVPPGLALGTVVSCLPDGVQCRVTMKPCTDIQKLAYCAIVAREAVSEPDTESGS